MHFRDHLPSGCPPLDANSQTMSVYYLVDDDLPTDQDFLSLAERNPNKTWSDNSQLCQSCGLSVFTSINGVELAKNISRALRKKKIAKGNLSEKSGKIKNTPSQRTGDTHHTWWPSQDINPCVLFTVIP
jgi:hypothetical protein